MVKETAKQMHAPDGLDADATMKEHGGERDFFSGATSARRARCARLRPTARSAETNDYKKGDSRNEPKRHGNDGDR